MGVQNPRGYDTKLLAVTNLLYGLSHAPENSEKIYYFLLVEASKKDAFEAALAGKKPFNVKDYATVIASGYGDPPEEIKEQLRIKYNAIL